MSIHISLTPTNEGPERIVRAVGVLDQEAVEILKQTCLDLLSADASTIVELDLEEIHYLAADAALLLSSILRLPRIRAGRLGFVTQAILHELKIR